MTSTEWETQARQTILDLDARKRQGLLKFDEAAQGGREAGAYQRAVEMGLSCHYEPVWRSMKEQMELVVTLDDICSWCLSTLVDQSEVVQRVRKTGPSPDGGCSVEVTIG